MQIVSTGVDKREDRGGEAYYTLELVGVQPAIALDTRILNVW